MTLRAADISEQVITGFRAHRIKNGATFAAMDTTPEELKDTVREACGVVEWTNKHNAWLAAKVNLEVKTRVDAVARAHGQPIQYLTKDWASMLLQLKTQYGLNIHECHYKVTTSRSKATTQRVIEAETLAHIVSSEEEREQMASKPEPPTQMGLHLHSTLTLQTKKRYLSRVRTDPESLRAKNSGDQCLVARTAASTWSSALRRPFKGYVQ